MTKQIIKIKKEIPDALDLPHGWKTNVAKHIGVHRASISRILKAKKGVNYIKLIESVKSLYGKIEY